MKKYSLYLFDFDGTLFDTLDSLKEVYHQSLLKYGKESKEEDYPIYLTQSLPLTAQYKGIDKKYVKEFIDLFHSLVNDSNVIKMTKLYEDTLNTFKYLNDNNIDYGIVSGSSTKRIKDVLNYFHLDDKKVKVIVGNDIYHFPKPNPEPILIALEKANYIDNKNEVIYIGDAEQDKIAAINAGIDYSLVKRNNNIGDINSLLDLFNN